MARVEEFGDAVLSEEGLGLEVAGVVLDGHVLEVALDSCATLALLQKDVPHNVRSVSVCAKGRAGGGKG